MNQKFAQKTIVCAVALALAGCSSVVQRNEIHQTTVDDAKYVQQQAAQMADLDKISIQAVREIDGVWLGGRTVKVSRDAELPAIFSQNISFQFPDRPTLNVVAERISKIVGMPVKVSADALIPIENIVYSKYSNLNNVNVNNGNNSASNFLPIPTGQIGSNLPMMDGSIKKMPFILDLASPYSGTLSDLLDQFSSKYGVGWDYKDGSILISRVVTRTYQVASLMDVNTTSVGSSKSGTTSAGDSSGGAENVASASSSANVSNSVTSKTDVAEGIKKAIEGALTPELGSYSVSSFGVVTVTDTREVQSRIDELISAENKAIARQVRLRMVMVEVDASDKNDVGVDWSHAINQAARKWNVDLVAPQGMLGGGAPNAGQIGVIRNGNNSTTGAFIRALNEVGRVSVKKDESYTLMNNRPLSVAQVDNFIYPARSTVSTGTLLAGESSTGVEPGQLTTGNFLNLRASVLPNGSVIVHFALDSSRRGKTETYTSNGAVLQYPQTTGGNYQTYASIPNGQTGVIAAIDTSTIESQDRSFDKSISPILGGGMYNNSSRKFVLILLTPYIIEGAG